MNYESAPIRIFVVWHPHYSDGETIFQALYSWLGGKNRDLYHRGLGVPVQAWTSLTEENPPGEIPIEEQDLTVIVPILDGEFLGRKPWRDWMARCAAMAERSTKSIVVLPWAVHQAAALLPGVGVLHLVGTGPCDARQLCRRVTEACVSRIRDPDRPRAPRIFISYARQDGSPIANEVRRALQNYGNLSVFLDEHDLQPGDKWREGLATELKQGAAMFAIVTDTYASRAWCREELREFREPKSDEDSGHWYLRPVYILDSLTGASTRSMFEVGNAPAARWNAEYASDVVDHLIQEMLFAEVNRAAIKLLGKHKNIEFTNWVPDTWTLLQVLRSRQTGRSRRIAYPGDGLPRIELDRLKRVFPGLSLVSFEELRHESVSSLPQSRRGRVSETSRPPVLLSISNPPSSDLTHRGMRSCHLDVAAIRIARALLSNDFDVMYGGLPREGFTAAFQDDSGAVVLEARLINYLGWPHTLKLTAERIADGFGVTRYARIVWPGEGSHSESDVLAIAESATHTRWTAVCQSLRDQDDRAVPRPAGMIALGGQLSEFAGFMPGVAEEIALALEAELAVYVLGGFGGAAQQVAAVMSGKNSHELTLDGLKANRKYLDLCAAAEERGRVDEIDGKVAWLWEQLQHSRFNNGLTAKENAILLSTANVGLAVALISKGLRSIDPRRKPVRSRSH